MFIATAFGCGEKSLCVCVRVCLLYIVPDDLSDCVCVGVILSVNLSFGRDGFKMPVV